MSEIRVGANGWRVGISNRQLWIEGPNTSTVVIHWTGELSRQEQRDMLRGLTPVLDMAERALSGVTCPACDAPAGSAHLLACDYERLRKLEASGKL